MTGKALAKERLQERRNIVRNEEERTKVEREEMGRRQVANEW